MAGYYPDGKGKPRRKPKFRPRITRIKLNPEQAVLSCSCYNTGNRDGGPVRWGYWIGSGIDVCTTGYRYILGVEYTGYMGEGVHWENELASS